MGLLTGVSVLALGVTVAIAFRELGWRGAPRLGVTLLVAGLALWTEPAQRALFLGQAGIPLMALVTWDVCQPDGRRMKGAATSLAAGVKLVPLLFIAYPLLTRRFRQGAVATAAFAGLMTCALTALLISPISWDHHWVWLAPGLALLIDAGHRAGRAWYALAAATWAAFAAWPDFWSARVGLLQGGLIGYAPATAWAYGDNPAYAEYHWDGLRLLAGNLELLAGLALFAVALAAAFRLRAAGLTAGRAGRPPSPSAARGLAGRYRPRAGSFAWPAGCPTPGTRPGQPGTPGQKAGPRHPRPGSSATRTGTAGRP
jgi:hypothetical protein